MLTMIIGGIGELFTDVLVKDEEEKRAAKAALWAVAGAVGVSGEDAVGVAARVHVDVGDGRVEIVDHADAQRERQPFGVEVVGFGRSNPGAQIGNGRFEEVQRGRVDTELELSLRGAGKNASDRNYSDSIQSRPHAGTLPLPRAASG